jgi:DNA polymerase-3 subunit gamma/tau
MAYQVIARKWRPQTFSDLVGQRHVTDTLSNAIKNNRVAHSYIFSGARGVGKTTAARVLAKALNCVKGPTPEPCGECDACREIAAGTSLDVIEIDAASNRGIDQIRELREMVRYAPAAARTKVVILDEAHMLTGEASNALLKTLEEPPDRVIFVMATTEPENLVDTIRSRSQHFHFRALTFNEISDRLKYIGEKENLKIETGACSVIARMAEGSMRDALSLLEQARAYCGDNITDNAVRELLGVVSEDALQELVQAILEHSADRALGLVHRFQKEGRNLQHFCREAIRHMRNLLIARVCGADSDLIAATPDQRPGLAKAAALFSEEDLTRYFQILLNTDDDLRRKPDPRVHLEMGLLCLVNAARLAPLEELLAQTRGGADSGSGGGTGSGTKTSATAPSYSPRAASVSASAYSATPIAAASAPAFSLSNSQEKMSAAFTTQEQPKPSVLTPESAPGAPLVSAGSGGNPGSAVTPALSPNSAPAARSAAHTSESKKEMLAEGLSLEQVTEIKTAMQAQQKFIGAFLEYASRWELDGVELRIYFPSDKSAFAGLIEVRETLEKIKNAVSKVLGHPVRVCARLDSMAASGANSLPASTDDLKAKFETDPLVKSMLQRFGGKISEVRRQEKQ